MAAREGHGWWPYLVPLFSFLGVLEIGGRLPESFAAVRLGLSVLVPAGFFVFFLRRGAYPELRGYPDRPRLVVQDALVGVLGGVLWMAPFVALEWAKPGFWAELPGWMRPSPEDAFDPLQFGATAAGFTLVLRCIGYGVVTPFVEEIFVRSFLPRYAQVYDQKADFRDVPIGSHDRFAFIVVLIFFTFSHIPWEWPVAVLWIVGTQLWFYHRKSIGALIVVHAGSNLGIFLLVWATSGHLTDAAGAPLDLWFFL